MAYTKENADEWFEPNGDDPDFDPACECDECGETVERSDCNDYFDRVLCGACSEEYEPAGA